MSKVLLPNNEEATIADFALESTAQLMLGQLAKLNGNKDWEKLVEHAKENAKDQEAFYNLTKKFQQELLKETQDLGDEIEKGNKQQKPAPGPTVGNAGPGPGKIGEAAAGAADSLDSFNKGAARGEKVFTGVYGAIAASIKGAATAITVYGGILIDTFTGLGNELNEMTKVGVGFTDGVGQGGMSATSAMSQLSSMGIDAAGTLKNLSGVVQTMSKKSFTEFTKSFMDATDSGVELGMSLDDSVERMGAELRKRQAMGVADGMNQARMNAQITKTIKTQQKYASVLGESVDEIVNFTDSLIQQTPVLTSSLLRFDRELRGKVISGITDFAGTMRAMGGEAGGDIAAAMTEAAASGQLGFSDSMVGYVTALPSLQGPMNNYIDAIKNGTLSQEDAEQMALDMTSQLGNLSQAEKDRIFLLDRAGNAQAASMAKAIIQFEASAKKIKDMGNGLSMEGVQTGTNTLARIMKEITGAFEGIKTGFLGGLGDAVGDLGKLGGETGTLTKAFKSAQETISKALFPAIAKIFPSFADASDGVKGLTAGAKGLGAKLGENLIPMIGKAAEYVADFISRIPDMIETAKDIGAGIMSFGKGFMSVMKVLGVFIGPVVFAFKVLASALDTVMGVLSPITDGFSWLGEKVSALANIFGDGETEGLKLSNMLGKLAGGVTLAVLAFKAVSGVLGLFGKSMPSMFANMGKSLMSGAKNMMGKLTGGLSKATGGKLDGLFGKAKEKLTGKSKEMDMGSKAMDTASKKSKSFTKSLATGMKDISKGISSVLTNLSKGISNSVSNIATGIQKGISALSKGIADAGKGIGKGIGGLLKGTLTGLGQGLQVLGNPKVLLGTAALIGIGAAMFVTGKAFQQFSDINWAGVAAGAVALGVLGAAAFLLAPIAPVIGVGALAIGALGLALLPFAAAVKIAAPAMVELMGSFQLLNDVDPKNVLLLGPALVSLAAGMAAFSAGGLVSGILDGLGSLLGQDSPFDKLAKIGAAAPAINEMTSNMGSFGDTVDSFNKAMADLDGDAIKDSFETMAEGIDTLNASMAEISLVSIMKMAAMKSFGPVQKETAPEEAPREESKERKLVELTDQDHMLARAGDPDAIAKVNANRTQEGKDQDAEFQSSDIGQLLNDVEVQPLSVDEAQVALDTALAAQAKGIHDFVDAYDQMALDAEVRFAQMDLNDAKRAEVDKEAATATKTGEQPADVDKEAATATATKTGEQPAEVDKEAAAEPRSEMNAFERKKARQERRNATMANGGIAASVSPEDAARARAQAPAIAKASMPTGATVQTAPKPESATSTDQTADSKPTDQPTSSDTLLEQMVKNQEVTNRLLKSGNRITSDLSDEF